MSPLVKAGFFLISLSNLVNSASLCGVCPPGHYMSEQCTQTKSRVCKPCPSGTYNDRPNMEDRCMPCKICSSDKNQAELSACTSVQNTVCQCAKDYYYSTFFLFCIPCKKCELGSGVVQHCTPTTNTVCRRCLLGETFSSARNSVDPCQPCRRCQTGEVVVKNCTRRHNQECEVSLKHKLIIQNRSKLFKTDLNNKSKDQNHRLKSDEIATDQRTLPSTPMVDPTDKFAGTDGKEYLNQDEDIEVERIVMYVMVVLVVVVFTGLLLFCCVRCKKRREQKRHPRPITSSTGASKPTKQSLVVTIQDNRPITMPLVNRPQADKMLRDVSYSLIDELSRLLNPQGRWKKLAGKLQFTENEVQNLNVRPEVATSQLLSAWGQKGGSTLGALLEATMSLGWDCESRIVGKYMSEPSQ